MSNILDKANKIVNERSEESVRNYGPFSESMDKTAEAYNLISGRDGTESALSGADILKVLIALKLVRERYAHKEDNLLDAVAYIGALNNYEQEDAELTEKVNKLKFKLDA